MTSRRKLLVGVLVTTMALAGVLAGTVSADNENGDNPRSRLMARVAEILGIDQTDVEDAFQQAMEEQHEQREAEMEAVREERIQALIDEGVVTQEQVDEWEAWMESRPDNREAMQEWFESRPDLGDALPFFDGGRGFMPGGRDMMPGAGVRGRMPGGQFKGCPNGDWTPPESQTAA